METHIPKRMAGEYEIFQAVRIGGKDVVLGVNDASPNPYLCAVCTMYEVLAQYSDCIVSDNFAEVMQLFGQRIAEQAKEVLEEQQKVTAPQTPLSAEDCYPNDRGQSLAGKVVALRLSALAPEYRTADHQLVYVTDGFGAQANARGNTCFCINLYTGQRARWERNDIQGEVRPGRLPAWAVERLDGIRRQQAEKGRARPALKDRDER